MIFIGLLLIGIGAWLTYLCRQELALAWQSRRWPQTVGYICDAVVHEGVGAGLTADGTFAPEEKPFRELDLVFGYTVAGQTYRSSRFSFSAMGWRENTRYLDAGAEVTVHYCPSDPSIAVLRPGLNPGLLTGPILLFFGFGFLLYGLCKT
jgi:hypothetical protein